MKPTKAIVATDNNPIYYPFWNTVSKFWYKVIGIEPVLVYVGTENPTVMNLSDKYGEIVHFNLRDKKLNFKTSTMAQTIRHFGATRYPDDVCILSDADMLPLNKDYYLNQKEVLDFDDDGVCFYSSDWPEPNRYPMCYIAAKGKNFKEIIGAEYNQFEEEIGKWVSYGHGWDTDEKVSYDKWKNSRFKDNSLFLKRGWRNNIATNRIDRVVIQRLDWNNLDSYIDFHMLRPYTKNRDVLERISSHFGV